MISKTSDYKLSLAENKEILDHERTAPDGNGGSHWGVYQKKKKKDRKITFLLYIKILEHTIILLENKSCIKLLRAPRSWEA